MLSELPRFNAARRYRLTLLILGAVFAIVGLALLNGAVAQARVPWFPDILLSRAIGYVGAALWIAAGGFFSVAIMSFARQRCLAAERAGKERISPKPVRASSTSSKRSQKWREAALSLVSRVEAWIPDAESLTEWPQGFVPMLFGSFAALQLILLWRLPAEGPADPLS